MQFRIFDVVEIGDEDAYGGAYPDDGPHHVRQPPIDSVNAQTAIFDEFVERSEGFGVQGSLSGICGLEIVELRLEVVNDGRASHALLTTSYLLGRPGRLNHKSCVLTQL